MGPTVAAIPLKSKDLTLWLFGFSFALIGSAGLGLRMGGNIQERVDEHRAAVLLGLPEADVRRYSRVSGLGHLENDDQGQQMVFTYEELRLLCLLAAQSSK